MSNSTEQGAYQPADGHKVLRADARGTGEFDDRRSRFLSVLVPVESEQEAEEVINSVRAQHRDARHNVWAWVLADGRCRCSDDGEPSRTAGQPILSVLQGANLANVCCVVTRYFGGVLLGPGGLVRAYTAAAQAALCDLEEHGQIVAVSRYEVLTARVPYPLYDRAVHMVGRLEGSVLSSEFAEDVRLRIALVPGTSEAFIAQMRELSGGQELCEKCDDEFLAL